MKGSNNHAIGARPKDTRRIDIGITTRTKEGTKKKIEEDKDTTDKDAIDNLHKNWKISPSNKSEV